MTPGSNSTMNAAQRRLQFEECDGKLAVVSGQDRSMRASSNVAYMHTARTARVADLEPLLALFRASEVSSAVEPLERADEVWRQTLSHNGVTVFLSESEGNIVATCMLITAPNLLRGGS